MREGLIPFNEQVLVITGVAGEPGTTTAELAAVKGGRLVLASGDEDALKFITEKIQRKGGEAMYVVADTKREADTIRIAQSAIRTYGTFHSWINIAQTPQSGSCISTPVKKMHDIFEVDYWSIVHGSRIAADHFLRRKMNGTIIIVDNLPEEHHSGLYAITRKASETWTTALRDELADQPEKVFISLVHPLNREKQGDALSTATKHNSKNIFLRSPDMVAHTILECCENPKNEVFVPGHSTFLSVLKGTTVALGHKISGVIASPDSAELMPVSRARPERKKKGWVRSGRKYLEALKTPFHLIAYARRTWSRYVAAYKT